MRRWCAGRPSCRIVELIELVDLHVELKNLRFVERSGTSMLIQTSEFLAFLRKNPGGTIIKPEITFLQYQDGSIDDFVEHSKKQIDTQIMTNLTRPTYDQRELIFFWFSQ